MAAILAITPADLTALRLLVHTSESGSVSAAARAAHITQPSASAALRGLERRLGLTLLVRSPQGSQPTAAGRRLVEVTRSALAALDAVAAETAALQAAQRREVRIAASYTIAEYVLPARLPPASEVRVVMDVVNSAEVVNRVRAREADVGFVEGPRHRDGLRVRRIGRDELVVVVAPGHPWHGGGPVTATTMAGTPLLLREPDSGTRRTYEQALIRIGLAAAPPLGVFSSTEALKAVARTGVGAGVLSRLAVEVDLRAGTLVEVPTTGLDLSRELRAVWLAGGLTPAASAVLRRIAATATRG